MSIFFLVDEVNYFWFT